MSIKGQYTVYEAIQFYSTHMIVIGAQENEFIVDVRNVRDKQGWWDILVLKELIIFVSNIRNKHTLCEYKWNISFV